MPISALGHTSAAAAAKSRTMEALILKRSSRVIPGLRGTPAGMITTSHPSKEACDMNNSVPLTTIYIEK